MKTIKTIIVCIFLIFLFATSCTGQQNSNEIDSNYPVTIDSGTQQGQESEMGLSYPINTDEKPQNDYFVSKVTIPTPTADQAVVFGTLLSISQENTPYLAPTLYLGRLIQPDNESENAPMLGSISVDDDPKAEQAINGDFVFTNVSPGEYGLFIWTPVSAFIIEDAKTLQPVSINVQPGELLDLGIIYVP